LAATVGDAPIRVDHALLAEGYFMTLGDDGTSVFAYREPDGGHLSWTRPAALDDAEPHGTGDELVDELIAATPGR
jgi:hypothetical protein